MTVLSTFPAPQKSLPKTYHHIYIEVDDVGDWATLRKEMLNNNTKNVESTSKQMPKIFKMIVHRSSVVVKHPVVQNLLKSQQKFDLFILGYNLNDMMLGLAGQLRIPSVILSTVPPLKSLRDLIGNPASISSVPVFTEPKDYNPSFRKRLTNFVGYLYEYVLMTYANYFIFQTFYDEHFPASENCPPFDEVKKNVSLIMTNTHFSEGIVRPSLPNLIEILGIHIEDTPNPLPKVRDFFYFQLRFLFLFQITITLAEYPSHFACSK